MKRGYQYNFSNKPAGNYDVLGRQRKAKTMVAVLGDYFSGSLAEIRVLDVGSSTGIIDNYLADHFSSVVGIDIDEPAIERAKSQFQKDNLLFQTGDALNLQFPDNSFDVVICSQIYEHVPDPQRMMKEIYRVLVPGGVCYFAAGNRIMWNEPHYNLPLLSVVPRFLANLYVRLVSDDRYYHELHYTYWGLKKLVRLFATHDYTLKTITDPQKYHTDYMVPPGSIKAVAAKVIAEKFIWASPGYIWLLDKAPVKVADGLAGQGSVKSS